MTYFTPYLIVPLTWSSDPMLPVQSQFDSVVTKNPPNLDSAKYHKSSVTCSAVTVKFVFIFFLARWGLQTVCVLSSSYFVSRGLSHA